MNATAAQPGAPDSETQSRDAMRAALARQLETSGVELLPPAIPDHTLLHRIGSGAYGDVWLARSALGTLRAVKIVYRARFEDERPYEREFHGILKFEPISRTHEGLVQVLHVGRHEDAGCFFYVMELADDAEGIEPGKFEENDALALSPSLPFPPARYSPRTLRLELRRQGRLAPAEAARLTLRLAGALAHLHAHGLVHRDVKPGNVIFVRGLPKLADIGLVTGAGDSRTFVGTDGFVPPEGPGSPQADIYGLGKLLYEIVTGRDRMDFPQLPPGATALPEREALFELNEVITRACAPQPSERYATADDLAADLNLFLAGRSLREVRRREQHLHWWKRFAILACGGTALAFALAAWWKSSESRAQERAKQAAEHARVQGALRARAEIAEAERQRQLHAALTEQARALVRAGEPGQRVRALAAVRQAAALSNTVELRAAAIAALALPDVRFTREIPVGMDATAVQLDPEFRRVAIVRGANDTEIRDASDLRLITKLPAGTNRPVHVMTWSRNGRWLALKRDRDPAGRRGDVELWEPATFTRLLWERDLPWGAAAFHPSEPQIALTAPEGHVRIYDFAREQEALRFAIEGDPMWLNFSPDGKSLAVSAHGPRGWTVTIHDTGHGQVRSASPFGTRMGPPDWDARSQSLAVAELAGGVHLLNARDGTTRPFGRHKAEAATAVFSPDGRYVLSGGWERELICWDAHTMQRAFTIARNSWMAQFSSSGGAVALRTDRALLLHEFQGALPREFREAGRTRLRHAAFSADNKWLAVSTESAVCVWDLHQDAPAAMVRGDAVEARLFFTPAGELLASRREHLLRWKPTAVTGRNVELQTLDALREPGLISAVASGENLFLTGAAGTSAQNVEALGTGERAWQPTLAGLNGVSPDGRWLAMHKSYSPVLQVYRLPEMTPVAEIDHPANIATFSFSADSSELAIADGQKVTFWSTANWRRTRELNDCTSFLFAQRAGTAWVRLLGEGTALCDARTFAPLLPFPPGTSPLAESADGRLVAMSVDGRRLQLWDMAALREQLRELGLNAKE